MVDYNKNQPNTKQSSTEEKKLHRKQLGKWPSLRHKYIAHPTHKNWWHILMYIYIKQHYFKSKEVKLTAVVWMRNLPPQGHVFEYFHPLPSGEIMLSSVGGTWPEEVQLQMWVALGIYSLALLPVFCLCFPCVQLRCDFSASCSRHRAFSCHYELQLSRTVNQKNSSFSCFWSWCFIPAAESD